MRSTLLAASLVIQLAGAAQLSATRAQTPAQRANPPEKGTWKAAVDPQTGRTYYWNTATRESRWAPPQETAAAAAPPPKKPADTAAADIDVEEDADAEEQYSAGEADFEEYTESNPSRPRRRPIKWMRSKLARTAPVRDASTEKSDATQTKRPAVRQAFYLGSVLAAAAAFL